MSIYNIHTMNKRMVIAEEVVELGERKSLVAMLAVPSEPEGKSYVHLQKALKSKTSDFLRPIKGGVMIPIEYLPDLKMMVDAMYNEALALGKI